MISRGRLVNDFRKAKRWNDERQRTLAATLEHLPTYSAQEAVKERNGLSQAVPQFTVSRSRLGRSTS